MNDIFNNLKKKLSTTYSKYQLQAKKVFNESKLKFKYLSGNSKRKKASDLSSKLKVYSNMANKRKKTDLNRRKKAEYLATLPKSRFKRFIYRMHPKRFFKYWFSKEGGIMALKLAGIGFAVLAVLIIGVFAYFRKDLPSPGEINNRLLNQTTKFYDRTGQILLYEVYGDQNRTVLKGDQISSHIKNATIAVEDKDFYNHGGFSLAGITRAAYNNFFKKGAVKEGGSTITQQFIKNSLLTSERTYTRKIKELILSIELERLYSKDEILTFYLNEISYGSTAYGVEAAAQSYFKKSAKDLTLDESAMLASMPQAPTFYSPYGENTGELIGRKNYVLDLMVEQGYVSKDEAEAAKNVDVLAKVVPLEQQSLYTNIKAPHFVLAVQQKLEEEFGASLVTSGGLKVITTLDWDLQQKAEAAVKNHMDTVEKYKGDNAALSASDVQTGQVLAMVGSRDFTYPEYGSYNAALSGRQPGSSFKPYGYAELFKNDKWSPGSRIYDVSTDFGGYRPNNFDNKFRGQMKVREALGESRNIPAVKALYMAGVDNVIELARKMGNTSLCNSCDYGLSLVLGAGEVKLAEHVHAYSTFARMGKNKTQTYALKVENANGEVIKEWQDSEGEQVLDPQIAYSITSMLTDDAARAGTFGRNNRNVVVPGLTHAAKTGTTDLSRDGWMMGYSRYIAAGVWVGNHDNTPMHSITSNQTGPIWTEFMREAHKGKPDLPFERVEGIKDVKFDSATGRVAGAGSGGTYADIAPAWFKGWPASNEKAIIDSVSGKLATECTPERAKKEISGGGPAPELPPDDPWFYAWSRSYGATAGVIPTQKDDVHKCSDVRPSVSISLQGKTIKATVTQGTHQLETINFIVDGNAASSQAISGGGTYEYTVTADSGSHTVAAEVVDKALYDARDEKTMTISDSGDFTISYNGVKVSWSSVPGASGYTIYFKRGGVDGVYDNGGSTNWTPSVAGTYTNVYVKTNNNKTSNSIGFTYP
ncbi:penicillin-binding protein [Candidatus Saccharibacteria bacterium CPR2]|nr:penicillin-binding protein [Candidatus Saccharibacteria bacterium CPR2]